MRTPCLALLCLALGGCGIVELGDNIVAPDIQLDEDFFHCRIQPEVISAFSCASGAAGEGGQCHLNRSSLFLEPVTGSPGQEFLCTDGIPNGPPPQASLNNFITVQFTVQSDALSSPFYRRPIGLDSHPREIFDETSPEAQLILEWINRGLP